MSQQGENSVRVCVWRGGRRNGKDSGWNKISLQEKKNPHKVSRGRTVQILKVTEQNKKSRLTLESELAAGWQHVWAESGERSSHAGRNTSLNTHSFPLLHKHTPHISCLRLAVLAQPLWLKHKRWKSAETWLNKRPTQVEAEFKRKPGLCDEKQPPSDEITQTWGDTITQNYKEMSIHIIPPSDYSYCAQLHDLNTTVSLFYNTLFTTFQLQTLTSVTLLHVSDSWSHWLPFTLRLLLHVISYKNLCPVLHNVLQMFMSHMQQSPNVVSFK